ncbi:hypothetical protein EDB92DRAFT_1944912 [Lactarius akahatsu]|uniref:Uncharacterized protein n=1 Tax=Lactarius akahatsu TaxID=416441 RepID=A0AAD4QE93_9AGAM|nr:hypothetical protein EDB92DRAFT_1944912 [Lactarius akahatsu]
MAPLPWKASWRRGKNIVIPSGYSGVDVGSGSERHGRSQGEHANPSSGDIVSSTAFATSTTRRASDDVHTSTPISSLPPTSNSPPSTTYTRSLSTIPSDTLSFPSPHLHLVSEPVIMTSSPKPTTRVATSSPLASNLPPTQKAEPSVNLNLDVVLSSSLNSEDVAPTPTSSNNISSSTFSSKSPATDVPRSTTTPLSDNSLLPTKCQFDASGMSLPEETNMPSATGTLRYLPLSTSACSLFTQDYTEAHNSIPPNTPSPQPSLSLDDPLGIPGLSSISNTITTTRPNPNLTSSSPLSSTLTGQTLTSAPPLTNGGKSSGDKPVRTTSLSGGLLVMSTPPGNKTTSVTTTLLSTTSVTSSSVLKTKTTDSTVVTDHPAGAMHTLIPSGTPQRNDKLKPEPSRSGSSVSLPLDSTSFPGEVGRIAISTASSPSLSTTSFITSTTTVPIPSLTSVDGVHIAPFSNINQLAVVDDAPSTTDFPTPTTFSQDITASFTSATVVVTFSPIQISGMSTSIPVTQTVQTVLPTVLPGIPATGNKKSVPIAAIVAPVSAAVVLILLLIGFMFHRNRQRVRRASQPAFDFSPPTPAPAMSDTEPAQRPPFKEVTVLPPIPTTMSGGWSDAFALTQGADGPFADPVSTPPSAVRLPDESPRTPLVLPPALTLDPFIDPPALVSTPLDDDGPSRLSKGSSYDESIARASISSSHVGCAM